jgi:hypothetical protein
MDRLVSVYQVTLHDFLTKNKSRVRPAVFIDLIDRQFKVALALLPTLVDFAAAKAYPLVQAVELVSIMLKKAPKTGDAQVRAGLEAALPLFYGNLATVLTKAKAERTEGPYHLNKERMRDLIKAATITTRASKKILSAELVGARGGVGRCVAWDAVCMRLPWTHHDLAPFPSPYLADHVQVSSLTKEAALLAPLTEMKEAAGLAGLKAAQATVQELIQLL